jgi:hypothetical protein
MIFPPSPYTSKYEMEISIPHVVVKFSSKSQPLKFTLD